MGTMGKLQIKKSDALTPYTKRLNPTTICIFQKAIDW